LKGTGYLLQATLISAWWLGLTLNEHFFDAFQFPSIGPTAFKSFLLPDLLIIALLSIIRSYKDLKQLEYVILGGFGYGTLYCLNASILTGGGYLSTTVMMLGLGYNLFLVFPRRTFRVSESDSFFINGLKTLIQIVCFWGISLVLFPWIILKSFNEVISIQDGISLYIGITCLTLFSLMGLSSAYAMVKNGKGTPLPIDQTSQLVVTGMYKYVRNPMAVAGIGQAISIAWMYQSVSILIYAFIGALLWHLVVRPIEEKDMETRFGKTYNEYRQNVSCWIPKRKK